MPLRRPVALSKNGNPLPPARKTESLPRIVYNRMMPGSVASLMRTVFVLLFAIGGLFAQTPDTATIQGSVLDQSRAPIGDADVTVTSSAISLKRTIRTGASGTFTFSGLPAGVSATVAVHKTGFTDAKSDAIPLNGGATPRLNLSLGRAGATGQGTGTGIGGGGPTDKPPTGDRILAGRREETPRLGRRV